MMYISTDHLLATALPLVYLADCVRLLGSQEAIAIVAGGRLRAIDAGSSFLIAKRRPVVLNPIHPQSIGLRARWSSSPDGQDSSESTAAQIERIAAALRPIGWFSTPAALFAAVGAPTALFMGRSDVFLICWFICVAATLISGVLAWRRREVLGLNRLAVAWAVIVAIICMPLAGTFARNLVAARRFELPLPAFAFAHLSGAALNSFRRSFTSALHRLRRQVDDHSAAAARLDALLKQTQS